MNRHLREFTAALLAFALLSSTRGRRFAQACRTYDRYGGFAATTGKGTGWLTIKQRVAMVIVALMVVVSNDTAVAQKTPEDSLKALRPAEGLEVALWASEPMVNNPTSMDIDSRGRVWIAEGLNYRMKMKQFDNLKRVDRADCIKILCDTDGDGRADNVTIFADNIFPVPLGLAIEEIWQDGKQTGTRVYVGNSPDLLVLEDINGDDKADRRYALLTGFRGVDSDHGLHGMTFGPDGKLYFTVGDARYGADQVQGREATFDVTDMSGRRLKTSNFGTTLRVNRDGTQLQLLSSGHRNNYKAAVDSFGNVFVSDNDDDGNRGCRTAWIMDGGSYGYQHPDSSRHWAEEVPGIIPKIVGTGNGAPGGLIVYEGDMLPKMYFGTILQVDAGTHQVNAHPLVRHGAGFRSDYDVLLKSDDAWFRPVDLSVAPDGSVFVCDWYDAASGGNLFSDQTTGRIYRLSARASSPVRPAWKTSARIDQMITALQSPNVATRLVARQLLLSEGASSRVPLLRLFQEGRPTEKARAQHVLADLSETGHGDVIAAFADADPRIREVSIRLLARDISPVPEPATRRGELSAVKHIQDLLPLAVDADPGVRRALLTALRHVPTRDVAEALSKMAASWDGRDRYYLEALRAALKDREPHFVTRLFDELATQAIEAEWSNEAIALPPYYPIGTNDAFLRPEDQLPPSNAAARVVGLAWSLQRPESLSALRRILQKNRSPTVEQAAVIALAGIEDRAAGELLMQRYFAEGIEEDCQRDILKRLGAAVSGPWKELVATDLLQRVFSTALGDTALQVDAIQAIARGKLESFGEPLLALAEDSSLDSVVRAAAISSLGQLKHERVRDLARQFIDSARGRQRGGPVTLAALTAINSLDGRNARQSLANTIVDLDMPLDVRRRALQLVTGTLPGVDQVLSLYKNDVFPQDLKSELAFTLHNHADRSVRRKAAAELPMHGGRDSEKIHNARIVLALQGDASRGGELFREHKEAACARCHRVTGEGNLVGPDLASIGMKYGGKELLYHIQYPSSAINYNFVAHTFWLEDGRILNGLVIDRRDGQVTLGIATGQHVTIAADEIEQERPQTVSLMPERLVASFTEQQLSDLIEYLLTLRQGDAVIDRRENR